MSQKKNKCYNMDCQPIETGINQLRIYVCKKCKEELTEQCYNEEVARIKRNKDAEKREQEKKSSFTVVDTTPDPVQDEFDVYLGNLGIDNTFKDWPV